jgi:hypothetical protein
MRTDLAAISAFNDYQMPLKLLEQAVKHAGKDVEFYCYIHTLGKSVEISDYRTLKRLKDICIEGDSPMQALRDVLAAVGL